MEQCVISQTETGLQIEGFPDAVKIVAIKGPKAKELTNLALHRNDLEFAESCLLAINQIPEEPYAVREALWRCAIFDFLKCFGKNKSRSSLSDHKVFENMPEALVAFNYFKQLRHKHLIHDENSYTQGTPCALLNNGLKDFKVEKIILVNAVGMTLEQDNYNNLRLLIEKTKAWIVLKSDALADSLTADLEKESYTALISRETVSISTPDIRDISHSRKTL